MTSGRPLPARSCSSGQALFSQRFRFSTKSFRDLDQPSPSVGRPAWLPSRGRPRKWSWRASRLFESGAVFCSTRLPPACSPTPGHENGESNAVYPVVPASRRRRTSPAPGPPEIFLFCSCSFSKSMLVFFINRRGGERESEVGMKGLALKGPRNRRLTRAA